MERLIFLRWLFRYGGCVRRDAWALVPYKEWHIFVSYEDFAMWVIFRAKRNKALAFRNICVSKYFTNAKHLYHISVRKYITHSLL